MVSRSESRWISVRADRRPDELPPQYPLSRITAEESIALPDTDGSSTSRFQPARSGRRA